MKLAAFKITTDIQRDMPLLAIDPVLIERVVCNVLENAANNIIRTASKKLIVIDGLNDYIIVDKEDVLLIYPKGKEQDIKKIVSKIE
jgi:K+-sensing histidine kinase KdpD